ncbi:SUMF1/EgtB/PvdOfamily nonheme iron enzyme [Neolewinella aurantiaca]|uniref:SUMF1/EgtB/PvdOfamily nonheme iron enzyme n=1 Tax=Neolewinella aurantiaca TaxID=2602767 RepID=A0A5C7FJI5_9BACT|nr:SUMF1/EgtB/PvdO family nonheme iron enzyme [Neolewinella aurantiaca]TXF90806.1 SUMF1/EgtB/PvdOfamily nonheme iron enzyme [Neolewinella aurantiaca]
MNRFLFILLLLGAGLQLNANNIEVTDIVLLNQDVGNETTTIQFDLSWENSWRVSVGPSNYDAAWVFAKYRVGGGPWRHAELTGSPVAPSGGSVDLVDDTGVFVYRSGDGSGNISFQDVEMTWDYGADNVDPNAVVDVQVFALEMVYVPEGSFYLGTGFGGIGAENEVGEFRTAGAVFPTFYSAYHVESEASITVGSGTGQLDYSTDDSGSRPGDLLGPIPAAFPKGFAAFYCMKYEMSQAQYVAFFNTLTQTQRENLDVTGPDGKGQDAELNRNGVSWDETGNATTTNPDLPLNYVNNTIVYAYLDWAALRPMTELEYEKAGRGPVSPVNNEFAWGTANIHGTDYEYLNFSTPNEEVSNMGEGVGNAIYSETNGSPTGPKRCGILAASAVNPTREETGGSYYGIMELTGNLYERCITVGNPEGRAFTNTHGDGTLLSSGSHNVTNWPSGNTGIGYRGGSYFNDSRFIRLSDRYDAATTLEGDNNRLGFRGVRSVE